MLGGMKSAKKNRRGVVRMRKLEELTRPKLVSHCRFCVLKGLLLRGNKEYQCGGTTKVLTLENGLSFR